MYYVLCTIGDVYLKKVPLGRGLEGCLK